MNSPTTPGSTNLKPRPGASCLIRKNPMKTRMTATSQKLSRLCKHLATTLALSALVAVFGTASAFAGALFTTDIGCNKVNGNIYADKTNVFLNGGPGGTGSALDPNTTYCILVSAPGGIAALNTNECRVTTDANGHFEC